jgi:hypothetical protein
VARSSLLLFLALGAGFLVACGSAPDVDAGTGGGDGGLSDAGAVDSGTMDAGGGPGGGAGGGGGTPGPNHPPIVAATITAAVTQGFAGQVLDFSITATDEDFDVLTYQWAGPGTFVTPGSPNRVRWFSPVTTTATDYTLSVSVTDGRSPAESRSVTVSITPPRFQDVYGRLLGLPVLSGGQCVGCHGGMGQYTVGSTAAQAWTNLVGAPHHQGAGCTSAGLARLVVANDAEHSLLYRKLMGTQPMACGAEMPRGTSVTLSWAAVAVGSWIGVGAPND